MWKLAFTAISSFQMHILDIKSSDKCINFYGISLPFILGFYHGQFHQNWMEFGHRKCFSWHTSMMEQIMTHCLPFTGLSIAHMGSKLISDRIKKHKRSAANNKHLHRAAAKYIELRWRGTTLRSYTVRTEVTVDSSLRLNIYIKLFEKFDNML